MYSVTNASVEEAHKKVMEDKVYGAEYLLLEKCLKKYPENTKIEIIALKIGLIDVTNSTNISRYKERLSVYELAKHILNIKDIDERIKQGDPKVVDEIANFKSTATGKITNLFSFASKYCCYHNSFVYGKDDYSIFDNIVKENIGEYFGDNKKKVESLIKKWRKNFDYKCFNKYVLDNLERLEITCDKKRRKFDHLVWFNKKEEDRKKKGSSYQF